MKKALLVLALAFGSQAIFAQDGENNVKNLRFGLVMTPMVTWFKPEGKNLTNNGTAAKIGGGLDMEIRLNDVACISTGFNINYFGGKLNLADTAFYFLSKDSEFQTKSDTTSTSSMYRLTSREYKGTYVSLPFTMKLKTPQIGSLTYYGQFGINSSVRWKGFVDDKVIAIPGGGAASQDKLNNAKDMAVFGFQLDLGVGAEWNMAGSTSMVFGLNYYSGFSNFLKNDSEYLFRTFSNNYSAFKQTAHANAFALTVGFLF